MTPKEQAAADAKDGLIEVAMTAIFHMDSATAQPPPSRWSMYWTRMPMRVIRRQGHSSDAGKTRDKIAPAARQWSLSRHRH
jgi:hypothetical protein